MPFGRRSTASRYSAKVSHSQSMPAASAPGIDVFGALEVADDELHARRHAPAPG